MLKMRNLPLTLKIMLIMLLNLRKLKMPNVGLSPNPR
jgi:hypothetical protein